jgi:polyisoprenoid-binding protein YceI
VAAPPTGDEQRDGHLGSPDFFDAERHPRISFRSTALDLDGDHGTDRRLTIKGTASPSSWPSSSPAPARTPGQPAGRHRPDGVIDRREFGIDWNAPASRRRPPARRRAPDRELSLVKQG